MRYEWDEAKNLRNQRKHGGISFELAALVFEDERCLVYADRIDSKTEERRWHAIGEAQPNPGRPPCCWSFTCTGRTIVAKKSPASSRPARLKSMRSEDIENRQWTEKERQALRRLAGRQAAGDDSRIRFDDIPRLTDAQLAKMVRLRDARPRKVAVSVRLDGEVLAWLKSKGEGHLTRINDILTNLMEAERRVASGR
ncbi:MAG TPA: BrnA antitoxin family protein [Bryobacteraceae bacterium]